MSGCDLQHEPNDSAAINMLREVVSLCQMLAGNIVQWLNSLERGGWLVRENSPLLLPIKVLFFPIVSS